MRKSDYITKENSPILIKNTFKDENSSNHVNIAPLLSVLRTISDGESNPIDCLSNLVKICTRLVGTADLSASLYSELNFKEELLYSLFVLEEGLEKCTEVNL